MKKINRILFYLLGTVFLVSSLTLSAFAADAERPSNVENLKGTAYNGAVKLTWDKSTDNVGVTGYQVHYGLSAVTETGQKYDNNVDAGNVTEYLLTGLTNGKKYYFSVIAFDAAGNESERWADELSLTPSKDAGDYKDEVAPKVSSAESLNKNEVKVVFSEEIVIPAEDPQDAFQIEDDNELTPLVVTEAKMDTEDKTNKTVILTTADQKDGITYKLTVTIDVEDKAENPVISGTSDTAIFAGTGTEKPSEDTSGPEVVSVESQDNTHVLVNFNETVKLSIDPSENFNIAEKDDATKTLTVLGVELVPNDDNIEDAGAVITVSPQEKKNYVLTAIDLKDEANNEVNEAKSSAIFEGKAEENGDANGDTTNEDTTPPKDVKELLADITQKAEKYIVKLSWIVPEENEGDSSQQIVYISTDNKKFDKKANIDPQAKEYSVEELSDGEYYFKLTQKDAANNESEGVIKKITLAKTGPGVVGLIAVSLILGRVVSKKKK